MDGEVELCVFLQPRGVCPQPAVSWCLATARCLPVAGIFWCAATAKRVFESRAVFPSNRMVLFRNSVCLSVATWIFWSQCSLRSIRSDHTVFTLSNVKNLPLEAA